MPTSPGITVWPARSMTCAPAGAGVLAAGPTAAILPWSTMTVWSSRGAAPVPSITRTWVSATTGASVARNGFTPGWKRPCANAATAEQDQAEQRSLTAAPRRSPWISRGASFCSDGRRPIVLRVALEEFDDAQHVIHALQRRPGARQLVADRGIAHVFHRAVQLLQRAEEHLALREAGAEILAAVDNQERRADVGDVGDGALFVEHFAGFGLPRIAAELLGHQRPRVGLAVERGEIVDAALRGRRLEALIVADHPGGEVARVGAAGEEQAVLVDQGHWSSPSLRARPARLPSAPCPSCGNWPSGIRSRSRRSRADWRRSRRSPRSRRVGTPTTC